MASLNLPRLAAAACLVAAAGPAALAAVVHDPWLERFQVGEFRDFGTFELAGGWPAGLFEPIALDPGWRTGAASFFAGETMPRGVDLVAWRIAVPALASAPAAEAYYLDARRQWQVLADLADPAWTPPADLAPGPGPWTQQIRLIHASRLASAGDATAAARAAALIVDDARGLGLTDAEQFAWSLRAACLADRVGDPSDLAPVWHALHALGPYDTRSGWAIWLAAQRHRGAPPIPAGAADRETAVMLATAGRLWLSAAELQAAGFAPDVEAGLGAILLGTAELAGHFARWPSPPEDGLFQGYWLRGQRRLRDDPAALEALATRPGVTDGHRIDHWRRASESHLLRGEWDAGLRDLDEALGLIDSQASAAMKTRLREWVVQALALAIGRDRTDDARRIVALAEARLAGEQAREFSTDAWTLLERLGRSVPPAGADQRSRLERLVRAGGAPRIDPAEACGLPDPDAWRDRLWEAWARWGLVLLEDSSAPVESTLAYRRGLETVRDTVEPRQRHSIACATAARFLAGHESVPALLDWAVARDIERLAGGSCLPRTSPLPGLRDDGPTTRLRDHALLGAALALGDDRGLVAMAVRLPAAGVAEQVRQLFWYPVPGDPAVRQALAESGLPPELLLAIARNESLFEPAIRSRAGALGYMQIMPFHYDDPAGPAGPDHWSHPAASLRAGARILAGEVRRYAGDPYRAVAAYNAGAGAVDRWDRQLGDNSSRASFWAWIGYPETRGYTLRVLRDRGVYRELLGSAP
ncbi:MAG TPA: transglycosylase SLT domain-containing protein [Candidatus Krumholzibacteria bacterium]|nr:transglycosylase SLT domain-containing protein [Candidatus Krumholzibacteria bacterium]HPD71593.1 transglycosylase SLT domain-containing protein [Candidatus Krumholzibacteria bacterium]HRY41474.1 transglycosylase SLT domain-containing protein [Candidatus Krumholzibacteria bacterium]